MILPILSENEDILKNIDFKKYINFNAIPEDLKDIMQKKLG
jgi:hypothetical protein